MLSLHKIEKDLRKFLSSFAIRTKIYIKVTTEGQRKFK